VFIRDRRFAATAGAFGKQPSVASGASPAILGRPLFAQSLALIVRPAAFGRAPGAPRRPGTRSTGIA